MHQDLIYSTVATKDPLPQDTLEGRASGRAEGMQSEHENSGSSRRRTAVLSLMMALEAAESGFLDS